MWLAGRIESSWGPLSGQDIFVSVGWLENPFVSGNFTAFEDLKMTFCLVKILGDEAKSKRPMKLLGFSLKSCHQDFGPINF